MKIEANQASVDVLKEFADFVPQALNNIKETTEHLFLIFNNLEETIGVHSNDFRDLFEQIKKAQESADEAFSSLPQMLLTSAEKIEDYIRAHPSSN